MQSKESILVVLQTRGSELRQLGVRKIGLFGSAVRGEANNQSDLDFLVEPHAKTFDTYMDVKEFLESLFGHRVDLVLADAIKPQLRSRILREIVYAQGL
jgi:predicted nucleotidyltransferase